MLPCMKRLAVSSRRVSLHVSWFRVFTSDGQWALVSRGSVSLVFALVKGEGYSPAHEGIRGVGAPSSQRSCSSGQGNIRAHPPVEPARDHAAHRTITVQSGGPSRGQRGDRVRMMSRGAGGIHRPIPKERIEDAGQAAGERDDGDVLAAARGNA